MGQLAVCWILYGVGYCEYHQDDCEIMTEYIVILSDYREEDWGEHTLVPTHTYNVGNSRAIVTMGRSGAVGCNG